jgi:hypothetical protein
MGEKWLIKFSLTMQLPHHCKVHTHAAKLRHGTDGCTCPPKEGMLKIFSPEKSNGFGRVWPRKTCVTEQAELGFCVMSKSSLLGCHWNQMIMSYCTQHHQMAVHPRLRYSLVCVWILRSTVIQCMWAGIPYNVGRQAAGCETAAAQSAPPPQWSSWSSGSTLCSHLPYAQAWKESESPEPAAPHYGPQWHVLLADCGKLQ